jgi:hypothetical protein
MGHDDLERRLRTEQGPREARYTPVDLPSRLNADGLRAPLAPVLRFTLLGATAAAAVLAVVFVSSAFSGGPGVGDGGPTTGPSSSAPVSATPTAAPSGAPPSAGGPATCTGASIARQYEPWGGAAGSRGTVVTLSLADNATPCDLPQAVSVRVLDAMGTVLVQGTSQGAGSLPLAANAAYALGISWSNWCGATPQAVLRWQLRFGDAGSWIEMAGDQASGTSGVPVPPCNGVGGTSLSVTDLQPAS